ncbi:MAG TPA: hypothetical protein VLJ68_07740 [Chitinophagaceae bacterium]|nr:hypothetical protein [Chitinophagaceae bacterium]
MKKVFTLSVIALVTATLFTSCYKNSSVYIDESYWLSQERGDVVYSDNNCSYFVVETNYGYTIIRSLGGYRPFEGSMIYGHFGNYGVKDFYNSSSGRIITGDVVEVDLSYSDAQYSLDYYCPYAKGQERHLIKAPAAGSVKAVRPK